ILDVLSRLLPLIRFNGDGKPARTDLAAALTRQRIAIEIPSDIHFIERKDPELAREWRLATRWAFTEALKAGFFVAEFCRTIRGACAAKTRSQPRGVGYDVPAAELFAARRTSGSPLRRCGSDAHRTGRNLARYRLDRATVAALVPRQSLQPDRAQPLSAFWQIP